LGRTVSYTGNDPGWPNALASRLTGQKLRDFQKTFQILAKQSIRTNPRDLATTTALLGRAPRPYEAYVSDMAKAWQEE
jgi:hypothetical protein